MGSSTRMWTAMALCALACTPQLNVEVAPVEHEIALLSEELPPTLVGEMVAVMPDDPRLLVLSETFIASVECSDCGEPVLASFEEVRCADPFHCLVRTEHCEGEIGRGEGIQFEVSFAATRVGDAAECAAYTGAFQPHAISAKIEGLEEISEETVSIAGPEIEVGEPTSESPDVVDLATSRDLVRAHRSEIMACFRGALDRDQSVGGEVTVAVEHGLPSSRSYPIIIQSNLGMAALELCVLRAFGRWEFPAPARGGPVRVDYPLVFDPGPSVAP